MTFFEDDPRDGHDPRRDPRGSPYPDAPGGYDLVDLIESPGRDDSYQVYEPASAAGAYGPDPDSGPPADLPPWYEDEYYDDDEWGRLPRRSSTAFRIAAFCGVLLVALLVAYSYVKGWIDDQLDPPGEPGSELVIEIPQGATTNDIARILADEGIVPNSTVFRYYLRFKNTPDFQAGIYTFRLNSAVWDVRNVLEAGPASIPDTRFFVTIPEGLTTGEIRTVLLDQLPLFDPAELDAALASPAVPRVFAGRTFLNYEGVLFPETYDVDDSTSASEQELVDRMVAQFDIVATETGLVNPPPALGVDAYEVLVIASLIEEEAKADEDRAKIARVIYNRLAADMPLGIDATVVYALGGDRDLSASDLQVDSPYNTRRFKGLPPTPIAAPGRKSIAAALAPEPGGWLYYALTEENGPGTHTFSLTLEEHNKAVAICVQRGLGCG